MRKTILLASAILGCMALSPMSAFAGEPVKASIGADIVSSYIFRGTRYDGVSIQPSISMDWEGLSVGAWGTTGFDGSYAELDYTVTYSIGGFTVGMTDYFVATTGDPFFDYGKNTLHVAELNLGYNFGFMSVNWYTNFAGAMGVNDKGEKSYSSYIELAAPFTVGELECSATIGASPWCNSFYGVDRFSVINAGVSASHDIEIGSVTIPAFVQLVGNPASGHLFMVAGISF